MRSNIVAYLCMLSVFKSPFEVVKEGGILHLVSGYRRVTLSPLAYDEKSCLVEKTGELSNLKSIQDLARFFRLK